MKKKLLFMLINMNIGGTEKALLNMLSEIPREKYDITIFMLEKYGGFYDYIPNDVNIEVFQGYENIKGIINNPPKITIMKYFKKGKPLKAIILFFLFLLSNIFRDRRFLFKYILKDIYRKEIKYDMAIAYAGPMDFISYFILNKIRARNKVQWIHFDVTKIGFNKKFASKVYKKFDKVFVVSDEAKSKLIKLVPSVKEKTYIFKNIVSLDNIRHLSLEANGFPDEYDGIRILTVGRLAPEKGQDIAIRVLAKLIKEGYKIRWYCLGDGSSKKELMELVKKHNLKESFIFLGSTPNPYPYIKQCNIYVQPSRYEGYCITLLEAKTLNKPIITTDVNGAKEQIINGKTGLIVKIDENEIYNAIVKLINNKNMCDKFTKNLSIDETNQLIQVDKLLGIM
ncbi:glycosyltransferase [Neobacillus mesonae]|uniref:glycosyltransferase n=1 Tax=Neobacillus mesonae TaxID=1193713 RepID=UPI00203C09AE|nr:glycosyltransferase [Neobacillus mesonae]MCM3568228.1 glycosyltransferase [Neobacillus mesonae]